MEKVCRKCALRTSSRPLFNFGRYPKKASTCKKFLKIRYFERGLSKILQKVHLLFPLHLVPFYGQDYEE